MSSIMDTIWGMGLGTPNPIELNLAAANASRAERNHFKTLYQRYLAYHQQFKFVFYLPRGMGEKIGFIGLKTIALRLGANVPTDIWIHFDPQEGAFRIGQIINEADYDSVYHCTLLSQLKYIVPVVEDPTQAGNNGSAHRKGRGKATIPKPRNSWIIYRQDRHNAVKADNPEMHTSEISKVISRMWQNESSEVKAFYAKMAQEEKYDHEAQYPGWKCKPRKSSDIKKRKLETKRVGDKMKVTKCYTNNKLNTTRIIVNDPVHVTGVESNVEAQRSGVFVDNFNAEGTMHTATGSYGIMENLFDLAEN